MQTTEIIITNILATRTAFGVVTGNNMEAVFIPGKVSSTTDLRIGQKVNALLIPNPNQPEKTPWLAVQIGEVKDDDTLEKEIRKDLESGSATASEIAKSIGRNPDLVARKLREMKLPHDTIYALSILDLVSEEDA